MERDPRESPPPVIEEIKDSEVITSYTRWVDAVQVRGAEDQEVFLTFSPRFEHIWLEPKRRLPEYVAENPANIGLRSQYALRLYAWTKKYVSVGTKRVSLEQLRKVLELESVKNADGIPNGDSKGKVLVKVEHDGQH